MSFPDISAKVEQAAAASPNTDNQNVNQTESVQTTQEQAASQAVYELEKLGRIKFKGEELTPDALEKAMLRMKDYTTKTQSLSKEREAFQQEQKFYDNLVWDLQKVSKNPALVEQFIKTYPPKFHQVLKEYLQDSQSQPTEVKQNANLPNVELMSRLEQIEKRFADQEVAKNEAQIQSTMDKFSQKYPDAIKDLVLARAVEVNEAGTELTEQVWESIFKQVDAQGKEFVKSRYGDLVKKQSTANEKARGIEPGGGAIGQAPKKMSFKEATEAAISSLTQR